jgi:hypothetical protein
MSSDWIQHTKAHASKTGLSYKESLQDHSNAFTYYSEKADKDTSWKKRCQQDLCADMYSLNAVNKQNSPASLDFTLNEKNLQQKRSVVRESFKK